MKNKAIIEGMARVHAANVEMMRKTPHGEYPSCKNALGTYNCERCGQDVRTMSGLPCPSIPREQRWTIDYPKD